MGLQTPVFRLFCGFTPPGYDCRTDPSQSHPHRLQGSPAMNAALAPARHSATFLLSILFLLAAFPAALFAAWPEAPDSSQLSRANSYDSARSRSGQQAMDLAGHITSRMNSASGTGSALKRTHGVTLCSDHTTGFSRFGMADDGFNRRVGSCRCARSRTDIMKATVSSRA